MKILYYAVNGSGQGCIFTSLPIRNSHWKIWEGEQQGCFSSFVMQMEAEGLIALPPLMWKDEPVLIELSMNVKDAPCAP